ncbi:MAG: MFS transporter [Clostridia bacterium]|nr:MFS transporter [Clostridia bacterium]
MSLILTIVIYVAFVSLGLPDSLLGSAWPVMHGDIGAAVSAAGAVSMIISVCTIISSLFSVRIVKRIGSGLLVAISVLTTSVAMICFSFATSVWQLFIFAIPYGLGAGAIDSCLNNYVALHLSARHMSWLHCCWGIGATVSPYIMGFSLGTEASWHGGYRFVALIQLIIAVSMFAAVPLWKKSERSLEDGGADSEQIVLSIPGVFRLKGVAAFFLGFLFYCALENLPMVWASTYFCDVYGTDSEKAAFFASMFYIGMTVSRLFCGFISEKLGDRLLIRGGLLSALAASLLISAPLRNSIPAAVGFVLAGIGCGPVYPCIIHSTPSYFGRKYSGSIIGVQMGFAYIGTTSAPYLFGKLSEFLSMRSLPFVMVAFAALSLFFTEYTNAAVARNQNK